MQLEYKTAKKYPELGLGSLDPKPVPIASDQYAHRFMAKVFWQAAPENPILPGIF